MAKHKLSIMLAAIVCALCLFGFAACSSTSSSGSAASASASSASQAEEEALIKADIEKNVVTTVDGASLAAAIRAEGRFTALEEKGFDIDAFAANMARFYSYKIKSIEVNGNTAVATITVTTPVYNDYAADLIDAALWEMFGEDDRSLLSADEMMAGAMDSLNLALTSKSFPTTTTDVTIDYVKTDGTWQMVRENEQTASLR